MHGRIALVLSYSVAGGWLYGMLADEAIGCALTCIDAALATCTSELGSDLHRNESRNQG
jgi:hypothetical protein